MASPDQPTATTIVTEAYNRYGVKNPTTDQINRGINYGLENVKDLMCLRSRRWKTLRMRNYQTLAPNLSIQTPYFNNEEDIIQINVWEPLDTEKALGVGSTLGQWILNASETLSRNDCLGKFFAAYPQASDGATASGNQLATVVQAVEYTPATKALQFVSTAGPYSALSSGYYRRLSNRYPITVQKHSRYNQDINFPDTKGRPTQAYISQYQAGWNNDTGFSTSEYLIQFDYTADKTYIMEWEYYVNLQLVNLSEGRYDMILRRWKALFTQGVFVWLLEDNSDDRYAVQNTKFGQMLSILGGQDIDGHDISDMQREVVD